MTKPIYADLVPGRLVLRQGDCLDGLRRLPDACIDSIVTDPPYGLSKEPDMMEVLRCWLAGEEYVHKSAGFMERDWDSFVPGPEIWKEALRVLKPGGHVVAFAGTRTYDLTVLAIRIAGFEIRDQLAWVYATGFPKSHDIAQRIEKLQTTGKSARDPRDMGGRSHDRFEGTAETSWLADTGGKVPLTTPDAIRMEGWGTALKPAFEPIVLARKPLIGTVAGNVLAYGTGGINIDACRIATTDKLGGGNTSAAVDRSGKHEGWKRPWMTDPEATAASAARSAAQVAKAEEMGRHPANFLHDGSTAILAGFPDADKARFFFSPKASKADRGGSLHPTVKPVDLMRWLVKLVTPPGGVIVDPFAGSGTTGVAIRDEGFFGILIERETAYCQDIVARFAAPSEPEEAPSTAIAARPAKPRKAKAAEPAGTEHLPGQTDLFGEVAA